jgi:hypothetical protein
MRRLPVEWLGFTAVVGGVHDAATSNPLAAYGAAESIKRVPQEAVRPELLRLFRHVCCAGSRGSELHRRPAMVQSSQSIVSLLRRSVTGIERRRPHRPQFTSMSSSSMPLRSAIQLPDEFVDLARPLTRQVAESAGFSSMRRLRSFVRLPNLEDFPWHGCLADLLTAHHDAVQLLAEVPDSASIPRSRSSRGRRDRRDVPFIEASRLLDGRLSRQRGECGCELQSPLPERQSPDATRPQSSRQCRGEG